MMTVDMIRCIRLVDQLCHVIKMTQLKELRKQAKEKGFRGYSSLCKTDLELLLQGKRVPKRLRRNQVSVGCQTDFPICNECGLQRYVTHLCFKAEARKIAYDGDMEVDVETGEVLG